MNSARIFALRRFRYLRALDLLLRFYFEGAAAIFAAYFFGMKLLSAKDLRLMAYGKSHVNLIGSGASFVKANYPKLACQRHVFRVAINDAMFLSDLLDVVTLEPHEHFFLPQRLDRLGQLTDLGVNFWLVRPPISIAKEFCSNFPFTANTFLFGKVGSHADSIEAFRQDIVMTLKMRRYLPSHVFFDPGFSVWRVTHRLLGLAPAALHFEGIDLNYNGDSQDLPIEVLQERSLPYGTVHPTVHGKNAFTGAHSLLEALIEIESKHKASATRFSCSSQSSALSSFLTIDSGWPSGCNH